MTAPQKVQLIGAEGVSHDAGVVDHEAVVAGTRWAWVEYAPGAGREGWCETPHSGYVAAGTITYRFEDGREPLTVSAGDAFALPPTPRHRGSNGGDQPARLFILDALPGS